MKIQQLKIDSTLKTAIKVVKQCTQYIVEWFKYTSIFAVYFKFFRLWSLTNFDYKLLLNL